MASKKFNREQMQQCLDVLQRLAQSGLSTQEFAQTQGVTYAQLRAWQSHAPRWRAQLGDPTYVAPARRKPANRTGFIQVNVANAHQPATLLSWRRKPASRPAFASTAAKARAVSCCTGPARHRCNAPNGSRRIWHDPHRRHLAGALGASDLRAGMDTLLARVVREIEGGASIHTAYVFANRGATRLKVLVYDGAGLCGCATGACNRAVLSGHRARLVLAR